MLAGIIPPARAQNTINMSDANEESILQSADALAEASARANRAQAEFKSRESVTSPGATLKPAVNLDDEAAGLDAAMAEVLANPEQQIQEPANPLAAPDKKPETPEKPVEDVVPEKPIAEPEAGTSLDDLLKAATAEPIKKEEPEKPKDETPTDPFAAHQLPANASAKSREHFDKLKTEAANREKAAIERASAAEQKAKELEERLAKVEQNTGKLPDEVEKELKELREHRALFDTENDPSFKKKFDARIGSNYEDIYSELKRHGLPDAEVAKLRAFDRQDRDAAIDGFVAKLDTASRRLIEAKLVSNISIEGERKAELQEIRGRANELVKNQQEAPALQHKQRVDAIANLVAPQIKQLGWLYVQDIPANTPPELRKQMEVNNEFALKLQSDLRSAIANDDPETRATAALSVPLAQWFAKQNRSLQAQVAELSAKLERITKSSSTSRLSDRATAKSDVPVKPVDVNSDPSDSIDNLFKAAGGKL